MERREYPRVKLFKFIVEMSKKGENNFAPVEVVNISAGGLCFLTRSIIYKGDLLDIRFPFSRRTIVLPGKVVRIHGREVGVQFTCNKDEMIDFVNTYNDEIQAMRISTKENVHLIVPGYNDVGKGKDFIDILLDIGPETKH
ncbi:MAG: PilZ domain-containing protein [Spirochaetes bacterium]|nr:PilZ domain-containing protein [Spirochaetota bacterium]